MTTLTIKSDDAQARQFIRYARTLPFVKVEKKMPDSIYDLKPEVRDALLLPDSEKGLIEYGSAEDMFKALGI